MYRMAKSKNMWLLRIYVECKVGKKIPGLLWQLRKEALINLVNYDSKCLLGKDKVRKK